MSGKLYLALAAVSVSLSQVPALAGDDCSCATQVLASAPVIGRIEAIAGAVDVAGAGNQPGSALTQNSSLVTKDGGSASLTVGSCKVQVAPKMSVSFERFGPDVCVRMASTLPVNLVSTGEFAQQGQLPPPQTLPPPSNLLVGFTITTALAIPVVIENLTGEDGTEASQ